MFLANDVKLAVKLNLNGAYIPSFNKSFAHLNYSFKKNFKLLGSAHNLKEMRLKEIQKVEEIFCPHYLNKILIIWVSTSSIY